MHTPTLIPLDLSSTDISSDSAAAALITLSQNLTNVKVISRVIWASKDLYHPKYGTKMISEMERGS